MRTSILSERPGADPLSDLLEIIGARCTVSSIVRVRDDIPWHVSVEAAINLVAITRGHAWVRLDDAVPVRVRAGDVLVALRGASIVVSLNVNRSGDVRVRRAEASGGGVSGAATGGAPSGVTAVCGFVEFSEVGEAILLRPLPNTWLVTAGTRSAMASVLLAQLEGEINSAEPGSALIRDHLVQLLFLTALRFAVERVGAARVPGWLAALADPEIAPAVRLMSGMPDRLPTVAELARACGMSRTRFASKFKSVTGLTPVEYAQRWRLYRAERELRTTTRTVESIAFELGFPSVSAFSSAFKRVKGAPPSAFRLASGVKGVRM